MSADILQDVIYPIIGRLSTPFDWAYRLLSLKHKNRTQQLGGQSFYDKTGILVTQPQSIQLLWEEDGIIFAEYESLAHSFWRAQELSLFQQYKSMLVNPVVDFGCGDGSFASILFTGIDYGVDKDPEALRIAGGYGIYKKLLQSSNSHIPLESSTVQTVISNSVLEHLIDLDEMLSEIHRILMAGGIFMFTVPIDSFRIHLAKYFGKKESERINHEYYHRNLLSIGDWTGLLNYHGFSLNLAKQYQPDWFTFWYRMFRFFGERGLGRLSPKIRETVWKRYNSTIIYMVKSSITVAENGANVFVIARKK